MSQSSRHLDNDYEKFKYLKKILSEYMILLNEIKAGLNVVTDSILKSALFYYQPNYNEALQQFEAQKQEISKYISKQKKEIPQNEPSIRQSEEYLAPKLSVTMWNQGCKEFLSRNNPALLNKCLIEIEVHLPNDERLALFKKQQLPLKIDKALKLQKEIQRLEHNRNPSRLAIIYLTKVFLEEEYIKAAVFFQKKLNVSVSLNPPDYEKIQKDIDMFSNLKFDKSKDKELNDEVKTRIIKFKNKIEAIKNLLIEINNDPYPNNFILAINQYKEIILPYQNTSLAFLQSTLHNRLAPESKGAKYIRQCIEIIPALKALDFRINAAQVKPK